MTRLSARLLLQRVDADLLVIVDESAGIELVLNDTEAGRLLHALAYFVDPDPIPFPNAGEALQIIGDPSTVADLLRQFGEVRRSEPEP